MAVRLTAAAVAERLHITEEHLWDMVAAGTFPAPDRMPIRGKNRVPVWDQATIADPKPRVPRPGVRLSRRDHLMHLFDEVVWWTLNHGDADIPQHAVGRPGPTGKPFPLGSRVSALRLSYRQGRVAPADRAMFERLPGWTWHHLDSAWKNRFVDVLSRWPDRTTEADKKWLGVQRSRWDKLQPSWQAMFEAAPDMLNPPEASKVRNFVDECWEWMRLNPGKNLADIAYRDTIPGRDGQPIKLGRKVTYYRRRYTGKETHASRISEEEIALIETLPGWLWRPPMGPEPASGSRRHRDTTERAQHDNNNGGSTAQQRAARHQID